MQAAAYEEVFNRLLNESINDLEELFDYLDLELSRDVADRIFRHITGEIAAKSAMPEQTSPFLREPWHSYGWRKFIAAKHYTVFLTVDNKTGRVIITRIFFSGMDIDAVLQVD